MSLYFTANPRDGSISGSGCNTCCCEMISLKPGETNKIVINYAQWSVPLGGRGLLCAPDIEIETNSMGCPAQSTDPGSAVQNTNYFFQTPLNTVLNGSLATGVTPVGGTFSYKKVPLSGPTGGTLTIDSATGAFVYTPNNGYQGKDRFFYTTTDSSNRTTTHEVVIEVATTVGNTPGTFSDLLKIDHSRIKVHGQAHIVEFPITMSPAAQDCEVFRVNVKQQSMDCDGNCYSHISCYDVHAGKC